VREEKENSSGNLESHEKPKPIMRILGSLKLRADKTLGAPADRKNLQLNEFFHHLNE
jgi:hypothetical protein